MGKTQSKGSSLDSPGHHHQKKGQSDKGSPGKNIPVVEEVFVQKIAYKCGVSDEELKEKKEIYLQHVDDDPTLGFEEFKCLYRDISGRAADIQFLTAYVEAVFRAFDANKDDQLTFQEWQVGFYLLLLLPQGEKSGKVSQEDFLLAMEIIFRLYDQDGNNVVTEKEIGKITSLLREPDVANRFSGGVKKVVKAVEAAHLDKYKGGISQKEFLEHFSKYFEENVAN
eukprot:GFUD01049281.1.p1 GENE.GFUD01049281.1~~GFUD01049281.1.p1  ORF type:complete len:225 (-),score=70.94 GFUD01049281.1:143-817(-)